MHDKFCQILYSTHPHPPALLLGEKKVTIEEQLSKTTVTTDSYLTKSAAELFFSQSNTWQAERSQRPVE